MTYPLNVVLVRSVRGPDSVVRLLVGDGGPCSILSIRWVVHGLLVGLHFVCLVVVFLLKSRREMCK